MKGEDFLKDPCLAWVVAQWESLVVQTRGPAFQLPGPMRRTGHWLKGGLKSAALAEGHWMSFHHPHMVAPNHL